MLMATIMGAPYGPIVLVTALGPCDDPRVLATLGTQLVRGRVLIAVVVACLLGGTVTLVAIHRQREAEQRTANQVWVDWSLDCPEGTLTYARESDFSDHSSGGPLIKSRRGWRCTVALVVHNDSSEPLRVSSVETPFLGSHGGAEVVGHSTGAATIRDLNGIDAAYDVDVHVPAHQVGPIKLAIGWREGGCNDGGVITFREWPAVVFEQSGRAFRRHADQDLELRTYPDKHDAVACPF